MRLAAMLLIFTASLAAQVHAPPKAAPSHANADQLGLTCSEILQMSSTAWVTKYTSEKGTDAAASIRAIDTYGKCYDGRTDELAASLAKSGKGPSVDARANFQNVEQALKTFTEKALLDSQPPADAVKSAYAALYEKQFRYELYEAYEPALAAPKTTQAATPSNATTPAPSTNAPAKAGDDKAAGANTDESDTDPVTDAKNHFGQLLNDLPDEQLHELHGAFGEILGPNAATSRMQLLIYRYAIFLLEPPDAKPFSPPPF